LIDKQTIVIFIQKWIRNYEQRANWILQTFWANRGIKLLPF